MRAFIALHLGKEAAEHIEEMRRRLPRDAARITIAKGAHCTLKFLGDIQPDMAEEVIKRLSKVQHAAFTVRLEGIGAFPDWERPRVLWVGLEPAAEVKSLQAEIEQTLHGLFAKERDFASHVTLARVKEVKDRDAFNAVQKIAIMPVLSNVSSFSLVKTTLTSEGPVYEDLKRFNLAAS